MARQEPPIITPPPPRPSTAPVPSNNRRGEELNRRSEEAAKAAQYVIDLEAEVAKLRAECDDLRTSLTAITKQLEITVSEFNAVKIDRDYHHQRSIEIQTKLTVAGKIILDAMRETPAVERVQNADAAEAAIANALRGAEFPGPTTTVDVPTAQQLDRDIARLKAE